MIHFSKKPFSNCFSSNLPFFQWSFLSFFHDFFFIRCISFRPCRFSRTFILRRFLFEIVFHFFPYLCAYLFATISFSRLFWEEPFSTWSFFRIFFVQLYSGSFNGLVLLFYSPFLFLIPDIQILFFLLIFRNPNF